MNDYHAQVPPETGAYDPATYKPVGPWCGNLSAHDEHADCTGILTRRGRADTPTDTERLAEDLWMFGNAYTVNGRRVPPEDVVVHEHVCDPDIDHDHDPLPSVQETGWTAQVARIHSQDEFLTVLDELLDNALHDDRCYTHPSDTECVCIIGRVRAVLPPCGAIVDKGNGVYWKCHRNAHPASPGRHVF